MLQIIKLKKEILNTNSIVGFETNDGFRVDISKKFLKKDPNSDRWYFTKSVPVLEVKDVVVVYPKTFITFGDVYIVECKDFSQAPIDATGKVIIVVQDMINIKEVEEYRGVDYVKETYRSGK